MQLKIRRNQDKGFLGGISFVLGARVELTPAEAELIKKYKVHKQVLLSERSWTIGDLIDGVTLKCKDVGAILNDEEILKNICKVFKDYLTVMASFGGEEIFEF